MKKIINILLVALIFTSCEDIIELDVPEGPTKLVVDALLTNGDSIQRIHLTTTAPYFDANPTPRLSGAIVFVTTSKGDSIYFTENGDPGTYEANYRVEDSTITYTLNIISPDGREYRSFSESLNRVPPIDVFEQSDERAAPPGPNEGEIGYIGLLTTTEPAGPGDFYRWVTFVNGEQRRDPFDLIINDDRLVDGNEIREWDIVYDLFPGDTCEIWQMSISERAFNYWSLVFDQITNFGGPFDTPPAPIEGNVYNVNDPDEKVLGFFGVSKVSIASFITVEK